VVTANGLTSGPVYAVVLGQAPAGPDLMAAVQDIEIEQSIDLASIVRIRLGLAETRDGTDWDMLKDDPFKPLTSLTVRVVLGSKPVTLINSYLTGQMAQFADEPGRSTLEVIGLDATLLMNLEEKIRPWPNLSDSDIAQQIFADYPLQAQVSATPGSLRDPEGTPTQRSTDMRFVRRLAQRNGFECYVHPDPDSGSDTVYFGPPRPGDPHQAVLTIGGGQTNNVSEFEVRYDMLRPTTVAASALDVSSKTTQPVTVSDVSRQTQGRAGVLGRLTNPPLVRPAQTGLMHTNDLHAMAQGVVDRASWAIIAEGTVGPDAGSLRPGLPLNIRGAGALLSGSYYVTRVTHSLGGQGYLQRFQARRNTVDTTQREGYQEDPASAA